MERADCEIGMVGLGVMGRNLLLNVADHGFPAAGYDLDRDKVETLLCRGRRRELSAEPQSLAELVGTAAEAAGRDDAGAGRPAGRRGDPRLAAPSGTGRRDDRRRQFAFQGHRPPGQGAGRARTAIIWAWASPAASAAPATAPASCPAVRREAYQRVRPMLEAVAAKVDGEPCVAYLGPGSAGHYVKMVHNGIEYGLMRLISETYHLMKQGLGLDNDAAGRRLRPVEPDRT